MGLFQLSLSMGLNKSNLIKLKASLHQFSQNAIYVGLLLLNDNTRNVQMQVNNLFV